MTVLDLESILIPVSADTPAGPNMEYEPAFLQLAELARGKPEQEIGDKRIAAQEPSWPAVGVAAQALLTSTKDLRVAGILHLALVKTEGIAGFECGLNLIRQLVERYWDTLHPMLDVEDDNDPTFRVNSLVSALVSDEALAALRSSTLVESRQFGKHSLRGYRIAIGSIKPDRSDAEESDVRSELTRIEAAFAEVAIDSLTAVAALIAASTEHLNSLQHILLDKAGGIPDDLKPLSGDLKEIKTLLDAQLGKRGVMSAGASVDNTQTADFTMADPIQGPTGMIRNRTDVRTTLDRICDYYAKNEPSSPLPLLLQRAKRLVDKDFMDIIRDLTPGGVSEAELIAGLEKRER